MMLQQIAVYGCLGVLLENLFTGLHTLIFDRNWRATTQSYLWMFPIYGTAGYFFSALHTHFVGWLFVPLAVIYIYLFEFSSGTLLKAMIGRIPWDYGQTRYGVMGLVRLDYFPFWLVVAFGANWLVGWLDRVLALISRM